MRHYLAAVALSVLAAGGLAACDSKPAAPVVAPAAAADAETAKLTAFLDAEFEKELAMAPERATRLGRKDNYDKLNDDSDAMQDKMLDWRRKSVADMKAQFDRTKLNADGQANYDIWALELDRAEKSAKYRRQAYVFGRSAPHSDRPSFLISFHRVSEVSDMEAYNSRLTALGHVMDQAVENAKLAADQNIRMPKFQYERVIRESQKLITGQPFSASGPDTALWADAKAKIRGLVDSGKATPEQAKALTDGAKKAMIEGMKPGYDHIIAWAKADMVKAPSGRVGAVTLPDGLNWYAEALYDQTTTNMTADEIHELGLKEVARIHGEMDKLAQGAGFKDRMAFLADRDKKPGMILPMTDAGRTEYLKLANAAVADARSKIPAFFGNLPKYDMVVEREPAYSEVPGGAAHASRATPDGSKPGKVYVHLLTPTGFIKAEIPDLMCHEGVPGHLLQGDIMVRQTGVPKFRTAYGYAAYSEGWGLYSEGLCKEMGVYKDAAEDYARLDGELWRAVRLVVDTGLHAKGWTEEEAVKYAKENTTEDDAKITQEVKRFLINPGQACAYKIGQLDILRMRAEAEKELGPKFDIKGFHDVVVGGGSLPLSIFEARVQAWIAAKKAAG
jgi:uncharacterized protein (DUF885 family)